MEYINPYKSFVGSFIPNWLCSRTEISPGAKLTYARLAQYAGKQGIAFPKTRQLGEEIGCSYGAVRKYLYELIAAKLIIASPRWSEGGDQESNEYRFLPHEWMEFREGGCPPSNTPLSAGEQTPCPPSNRGVSAEGQGIEEENQLRESLKRIKRPTLFENTTQREKGFDAFYKLYPKKVGKAGAIRAWKKIAVDLYPKIMARLETFLKVDWVERPLDRWPDPASWLNGARWEDAVIQPTPKSNGNVRAAEPDYPGWDAEEFERKHVINSPHYQGKR